MHHLTLLESSFLRILKQRLTAALNDYAVDASTDAVDGASALGVSNQLFARSVGTQMDAILDQTQIVNLETCNINCSDPVRDQASVQTGLWSIHIKVLGLT